jgi:hypothetical protein
MRSGRRRAVLEVAAAPLAWKPGGDLLATGPPRAGEDTVLVWSLRPPRRVAGLRSHPGAVTEGAPAVAWSPDGTQVVTGAEYRRREFPVLWRTEHWRQEAVVEGGRRSGARVSREWCGGGIAEDQDLEMLTSGGGGGNRGDDGFHLAAPRSLALRPPPSALAPCPFAPTAGPAASA